MSGWTGPPTALFVGTEDELATTTDNEWLHSQMGDNIIHYKEYPMGHLTFMVGKDIDWFFQDAMPLLESHPPIM